MPARPGPNPALNKGQEHLFRNRRPFEVKTWLPPNHGSCPLLVPNRKCALCRASLPTQKLMRLGKSHDYMCRDQKACYDRKLERKQVQTEQECPKCGSHDLNIEGSFDQVNLELDQSDRTSALMKFGYSGDQSKIECSECHTQLKITVDGLREK